MAHAETPASTSVTGERPSDAVVARAIRFSLYRVRTRSWRIGVLSGRCPSRLRRPLPCC
jgi:hypothetical protein